MSPRMSRRGDALIPTNASTVTRDGKSPLMPMLAAEHPPQQTNDRGAPGVRGLGDHERAEEEENCPHAIGQGSDKVAMEKASRLLPRTWIRSSRDQLPSPDAPGLLDAAVRTWWHLCQPR